MSKEYTILFLKKYNLDRVFEFLCPDPQLVENIRPTKKLFCNNIFGIYIYTLMSKVYTILF